MNKNRHSWLAMRCVPSQCAGIFWSEKALLVRRRSNSHISLKTALATAKQWHYLLFTFFFFLLTSVVSAEPIKVACVGDSITFGHPGPREKSYPAVLGTLLGQRYEVRNFGQNAATLSRAGNLPYWKFKAFEEATAYQPNIVIIALGANDSKVEAWMAAEPFSKDLKDMVTHFRQLPSKPLVLLGIPIPVAPERTKGITAKKVRERITPIIQQVAREIDAPTIDFYTPLAGKFELLPDTIHPNEQGYRIMAETAAAAIKRCEPADDLVPRRRRVRWRR
ncbi:MAG: hypothetical protein K8T91_09085 [Planctomycetes bacterium]|nr:hypothetical protein [Planctomycetota bacterium]